AARIGIPARKIRRRIAITPEPATEDEVTECVSSTLTVVGERCFGEGDATLALHARRLAAAARVAILAVYFDSPEADAKLLGAALRPDKVSSPEIANAILETFDSNYGC